MRIVQLILAVLLMVGGLYLFIRGIYYSAVLPFPVLMIVIGALLSQAKWDSPVEKSPEPKDKRLKYVAYCLFGLGVGWTWLTSTMSDDVRIVFWIGNAFIAAGAVVLSWHLFFSKRG